MGNPPLATPESRVGLFTRVLDVEHMRAVLGRALSILAGREVRVRRCSAKPARSRSVIRDKRLSVAYRVGVEIEGASGREVVLLGTTPVEPDFLGAEARKQSQALAGHPSVAPFAHPSAYVEDLRLGLFLFPLDPALPALAEITGAGGARLVEPHLPECRQGAAIERVECSLRHYKPFNRAVLRATAVLSGEPRERSVYIKLFADERAAKSYADLRSLWEATRRMRFLRVPEPLGYDDERRMLVLGEAPGERDLTEWIKCLEKGQPLPAGVDLERLRRALSVVAGGIVELQRSQLPIARRRTFGDELEQLTKDRDLLRTEVRGREPELVVRAERILERLQSLHPGEEKLLPAHGGFRHKQMVGDEEHLSVIDWDGLCLANPALDAATFVCRLRQESMRSTEAQPELDALADDWVDELLGLQPEITPAGLALYEGLVLTERMLRAFRRPGKGTRMADQIQRFSAAAEQALDRHENAARS